MYGTRTAPRLGSVTCLLLAIGSLLAPAAAEAVDAGDLEATLTFDQRLELIEVLERSQAQTLALVARVPADLWTRKPAPDRWSVGEVVEHLALAEDVVRGTVAKMLEGEVAGNWREVDRATVAELVALGSDRSRKFTAPEPLQPNRGMTREEALGHLLERRADTLRYVRETDDPLRAYTGMTPVGLEANGRVWLAFLAAHNIRHNKQIEEVLAAVVGD